MFIFQKKKILIEGINPVNSVKFCLKKIEPNRTYNEFLSKIKLVLNTILKKQHYYFESH